MNTRTKSCEIIGTVALLHTITRTANNAVWNRDDVNARCKVHACKPALRIHAALVNVPFESDTKEALSPYAPFSGSMRCVVSRSLPPVNNHGWIGFAVYSAAVIVLRDIILGHKNKENIKILIDFTAENTSKYDFASRCTAL